MRSCLLSRVLTWLMLGLLLAAPLVACGKKGNPESDPPTIRKVYPAPDRTLPAPG